MLRFQHAHSVLVNRDFPKRRGRLKNIYLESRCVILYTCSVLSTYTRPSSLISGKYCIPIGYILRCPILHIFIKINLCANLAKIFLISYSSLQIICLSDVPCARPKHANTKKPPLWAASLFYQTFIKEPIFESLLKRPSKLVPTLAENGACPFT